ncbi:MAG: glycosyltransferase family 9 protein [Pirellulales bacterium]|nr:glycosyltransferase family 9 protein [Pirellulales bacterium]
MPTMCLPTPTSPRIAIVRLSAIGDVIHGLPVLCALRQRFPRAALAWVVEERAAALLRGHPSLDNLMTVPRGWLKSPKSVLHLRRQLRQFQADIAIDLQGLAKSALVARLTGARVRIGFGDEKGRELSWCLNNRLVRTTAPHIIDSNLELLRPLGIESPAVRFEIPETPADRESAERFLAEAKLTGDFAVINPGAGWPSKLWPAERYAAVGRHLGRAHGLPSLVVWAGRQERGWADEIVAGSEGHGRMAPSTSLTELAALLRRARLFVGSDTGPLHLAAAVATPCVGLYGPMPAERNGPYGPGQIAIQRMHFDGTSRQRRNASTDLMEAITVDHVCDACDRILQRRASGAA